ncbi:hypothetical protein SGRI78S_05486 [Streptomyces griseus subsp. griseus]
MWPLRTVTRRSGDASRGVRSSFGVSAARGQGEMGEPGEDPTGQRQVRAGLRGRDGQLPERGHRPVVGDQPLPGGGAEPEPRDAAVPPHRVHRVVERDRPGDLEVPEGLPGGETVQGHRAVAAHLQVPHPGMDGDPAHLARREAADLQIVQRRNTGDRRQEIGGPAHHVHAQREERGQCGQGREAPHRGAGVQPQLLERVRLRGERGEVGDVRVHMEVENLQPEFRERRAGSSCGSSPETMRCLRVGRRRRAPSWPRWASTKCAVRS